MTIKVTFSSIEVTISIVYLSSVTLLEPFARAQVQDRGGEKHKRCDSENGVVHGRKNRLRVLRKCSEGDKEVVSGTKREVKKQRRNEVTIKPGCEVWSGIDPPPGVFAQECESKWLAECELARV
jgi:hypothetical protein